MTDRTFDRVPRWDLRNGLYSVRDITPPIVGSKPVEWRPGTTVLDQGREGACVGFGWCAELMGSPERVRNVTDAYALDVYRQAKVVDEWEGEDYDGTSVLAGAKVLKARGYLTEYRWAHNVEDIITTLCTIGPVVGGVNWYDSMYDTRPSGLVEVSGPLAGGHCIWIYGYHPKMRIPGESWLKRFEVVKIRNSWGPDYGKGGSAYIKVEDLPQLFGDEFEACVPVGRTGKLSI